MNSASTALLVDDADETEVTGVYDLSNRRETVRVKNPNFQAQIAALDAEQAELLKRIAGDRLDRQRLQATVEVHGGSIKALNQRTTRHEKWLGKAVGWSRTVNTELALHDQKLAAHGEELADLRLDADTLKYTAADREELEALRERVERLQAAPESAKSVSTLGILFFTGGIVGLAYFANQILSRLG